MESIKRSYTFNYIKIYFWQFFSVFVSITSMFIVMPKLTSNPKIYGIYCLCTSVTIFLGYADLGFIGAGIKYASEFFAQKKRKEEIEVISFSCFVLFLFLILFSIVLFIFSYNPSLLIKDIGIGFDKKIASSLFFILAIFTPTFVLQKILIMIFSIRLEDYVFARITIFFNLIKIASVFYFFSSTRYDIVGYYLFFNSMNVLSYFAGFVIVKKRYVYNLTDIFKNFYFSKKVFDKVKKLAFVSFYSTVVWVLFNEIDMFVIAKILGGEVTAFYGVAFTLSNFFKMIYGIIYSPYCARINHFIGLKDDEGLKKFSIKSIYVTLPFVIFPVLSVVFFSKNIIYTWVGDKYIQSIFVLRLLSLCYLHSFISYISGNLLMAREKTKELNLFYTIVPILYWFFILLFFNYFEFKVFAISKLLTWTYMFVVYFVVLMKFLDIKPKQFIFNFFSRMSVPIIIFSSLSFFSLNYLPIMKSKFNFSIVVFVGGCITGVGFVGYYFTCNEFRTYAKEVFFKVKYRFVRS